MTAEYVIPRASALSGWRKSSYSGADQGNCVEVIDGHPVVVPVRDSKRPHGPALLLPPAGWAAFVAAVKSGDLAG
ncbi:DUF397 domain-containing protein [Streptomyces scabiei]|uniref:DUF397 domain-containing protein n=1 Tax=Streptomyces TaxID=1883 RepID=UPI0029B186B0|nr:DUF397 domain-containing protein [Streptomyces scabiei]MDX3119491.1 DUF397 domain-containing protein [Streptomyces scabiei]